jgi:hypothetical protein
MGVQGATPHEVEGGEAVAESMSATDAFCGATIHSEEQVLCGNVTVETATILRRRG